MTPHRPSKLDTGLTVICAGVLLMGSLAPTAATAQDHPTGAVSATAPVRSTPPSPVTPDGGPATAAAPLTVQGRAPKVIERQSKSFVNGYAAVANPEIGQIARWYDPVCVTVVGDLAEDQAALVKARIESVAQALGVRAPDAGCTPNVEVVFTDRPQEAMDIVAERREYLLGYYHLHLRDQLKRVTHPIQSWYVTASRGSGTGAAALAFAGVMSQQRFEVVDDPWNIPPNGCANTRLDASCLRGVFHNVFIVVDTRPLDGKPLGIAADYITMLALSEPRLLDRCYAMQSILDLFARPACEGRPLPDGLTPSDAAYLTALYQADLEAKTKGERGDITERMSKILIKAETPKR